jgi:methyltransferase (TIGR00027 family)
VFEVDHPATQAFKRRGLGEAGLAPPATLAFVPVDFERDDLAHALARAGFSPGRSTFVIWLGVTPYLEKATVLATWRWIAAVAGAHGGVAFDYRVTPGRLHLLHRWLLGRLAARVAEAGEPFRSTFAPGDVRRELERLGFAPVEDRDGAALNARYFAGRRDGLRVSAFAHVVLARSARSGGT